MYSIYETLHKDRSVHECVCVCHMCEGTLSLNDLLLILGIYYYNMNHS